jgi:hypothetical protein
MHSVFNGINGIRRKKNLFDQISGEWKAGGPGSDWKFGALIREALE